MPESTAHLPYGGRETWVGDWRITPVFDGYSREDPTQFYLLHKDAPAQRGNAAADWLPHPDLLDEDGLLEHGLGGFLLRRGDRVVLVDCGVGPNQIGPYGPAARVIKGGEMMGQLAAIGVAPAEITDLIFTHLHPDHYGWAIEDNGRLFPNAAVRCHTLDWQHFVVKPAASPSGWAARLPALEDRLVTWDRDETVLPGIDVVHAPGHTPGSSLVAISGGHERALLLGDVVHCPVELVDTDWAMLGDVDPELSQRTRVALARELETSGVPAAGAHFPGMGFGRLLQGAEQRRWLV